MSVFTVAALPAKEGDCLVVSYGAQGEVRHMIIDAGHTATAGELGTYLKKNAISEIELLVITHVDLDHIEGILSFLDDHPDLEIKDIWFNGYKHLQEGLVAQGPLQGEQLTDRIHNRAWNKAFAGRAVRLGDDGSLPVVTLAGGLKLTVLSPSRAKLLKMVPVWERECARAKLIPGEEREPEAVPTGLQPMGDEPDIATLAACATQADSAAANGSSIAFLTEYSGKTALFGADAHSDILVSSLGRLNERPFPLDLLKVPHHGSQANVTTALMKAISCSKFLISTNGAKFHHPDKVAVARLIVGSASPAQLYFNYRSDYTVAWSDRERTEDEPGYDCHFAAEDEPQVVRLL